MTAPRLRPPEAEELLPLREFCRLTGIKLQTVRKWITLRKIESVKLGGVRIPKREITRLIAQGWRPQDRGSG